jgi:NAD(P)-dependent dehydrogenase (short-subunit alcohol dehydrogenase family)
MFSLEGKKVMVTGASRGIGRALAKGLARQGAAVCCVARSEQGLRETVEEIIRQDGDAVWLRADLSDGNDAEDVVARAIAELGGLDVLVNNAATDHASSVVDTDIETWDHVIGVNLRAPFLLAHAAGTHMLQQGSGKVINVTSILSRVAVRNNSAYISAKTGLLGFTRALALEWARKGVQVNALAPGFIRTEMTQELWENERGTEWVVKRTPMGRWGEVDDLIGAAIFLASPASDFMTGQALYVDGGWTVQ